MDAAGYSGTPLAKKLGIKEGARIRLVNAPEHYFDLLHGLPETIQWLKDRRSKKDMIHYFAVSLKALEKDIAGLKQEIEPSGMIWISWPKKASTVATDISEQLIRDMALANRLVDIKVCAVDETWSGLKLVIPVKYRTGKG